MKILKSGVPEFEAKMFQEILLEEGIFSELVDSHFAYTDSIYFGSGGLVDIIVPDEVFDEAVQIFEDLKKTGKEEMDE
ncbi:MULTISPECIES: DUF2007 domain-containing protein [Mesotoga]|jgi:hypothetical protein|uniref:DUF2007 domain-containing protein n=1 Tax=Mesotoga TaxID=1184396 RepID=UPI000EF13271|nr:MULTISPECIES: DUF2007 domain-containing protein [Mesotoga]MCP5457213.1 DUF2007 domain-containing protein [Thermotogota bacterium]MCP5461086.1 DUF2007 domain-containing protein [Thermotogota bacterium]RLL84111.1 hypothetical protein Y696_03035 [Mesotoga sp. H07pep.5.4]HNQ70895.1 DUF2007 domain-containing protein [Mesotoga prima]HNS75689.1 DUF2007 domain-containing protein [Mesotoga prima]